jgi:hypothetical protein
MIAPSPNNSISSSSHESLSKATGMMMMPSSSSSLLAQLRAHPHLISSPAMIPRITQALLELEAAESLLAKTRVLVPVATPASAATPTPTPTHGPSSWLMNSGLSSQVTRPVSPTHTTSNHRSGLLELKRREQAKGVDVLPLPSPRQPCEQVDPSSSSMQNILGASAGMRQYYVPKITELDVMCGRGGKTNHHAGNKRYRQVVSQMKASYKHIESKSAKTDLSRAIVEHVFKYGGRFLKADKDSGKFILLTPAEARKKTSQALREAKHVMWTA